MPAREDVNAPEEFPVFALAGPVVFEYVQHVPRVNEVGVETGDRLSEFRGELVLEPLADGHVEPLLVTSQDVVGEPVLEGPLENALLLASGDLVLAGERHGVLNDSRIEEGNADLQRIVHAREVRLVQDLVWQPEAGIDSKDSGHVVLPVFWKQSFYRTMFLAHALATRCSWVGSTECPSRIIGEDPVPLEVAVGDDVDVTPEELLGFPDELATPAGARGFEAVDRGRDEVPPQGLRKSTVVSRVVLAAVLAVAREEFVGTVARERDLHVVAGLPGDDVGGEQRRVGEGLAEPVEHRRDRVPDLVGRDSEFGVVGAVVVGDLPGSPGLIEQRLLEAHRERLDGVVHQVRHSPDDDARVDAAAQERAERNVTHQALLDGRLDTRPEIVDCLFESGVAALDGGRVESVGGVPFGVDDDALAGLELTDVLEDGPRRGDVSEGEVLRDGALVDAAVVHTGFEERG